MDLSLLLGAGLLFLTAVLYVLSLRSKPLARLYSPLSLSLCTALLLIICLCMGLFRQQEDMANSGEIFTRIGMRSLKDSVLLLGSLLLFTVLLGMYTLYRFHRHFRHFSNLIPAGLFIALTGLILGSFSLERYTLQTWKNAAPNWMATDADFKKKQLPFALSLNDFRIDYHDPVLYIVESRTGIPLPEKHPQKLTVDREKYRRFESGKGKALQESILDHEIRVLKYLPEAWCEYIDGKIRCSAVPKDGSAPAVLVETVSPPNGTKDTAWISCGSFLQLPAFLRLDTARTLGMGKLRPSGYTAEITLYEIENQEGEIRQATLRPNHPVRTGNYGLYLKSYKENHGFWDPYIDIEIIRDPWKAGVDTGIILLLAGLTGSLFQRLVRAKRKTEPNQPINPHTL